MKSLQPEASIANIDDGSGPVAATQVRLTEAGIALVERAAETGLAGNVATLYRDDPLKAEAAFRDMVFGLARSVLKGAFEALDGHGPSLEANGRTYRKAEVTPGRAMTMFGPVDFLRSRYRPSGTGTSLVPAEAVLGLTACGLTPAAGLSMYLRAVSGRRSGSRPDRRGRRLEGNTHLMVPAFPRSNAAPACWQTSGERNRSNCRRLQAFHALGDGNPFEREFQGRNAFSSCARQPCLAGGLREPLRRRTLVPQAA